MPIDTTPSTVATNALQAIPFSSLIGGPLDACIQAQAQAAKTSWDFIRNVGLTPDGKEAINVTFSYLKDGQSMNLIVPLLTIVPIPYIAIDSITIDFKANISASSSSIKEDISSEEMGGEVAGSASLGWGPFKIKADFKANYSSKKDSKATEESKYSVEYTMDIHVGAGQSSMPAGLATVLNILQSSITEAKPGGSLDVSPLTLQIVGEKDAQGSVLSTPTSSQGKRKAGAQVTFELAGVPSSITLKNLEITKGSKGAEEPTPTKAVVLTDDDGEAAVTMRIESVTDAFTESATAQMTVTGIVDVDGKETSATKSAKVIFLK